VGRWWTLLLRGLTAVAFGVLAFAWPRETSATLLTLFGLYALVHGILSLIAAIDRRGQHAGRRLLAIEAGVGVSVGILTLRAPSKTAMVLVLFVWVWAIVTGIVRIFEAIRLRHEIRGELWLALSAAMSILFGLVLMVRPILGVVAIAWVIAAFALVIGLFEILLGCELRAIRHGRAHS
jgi:uncharacterized membrane protein HdeD (DUF308 family)